MSRTDETPTAESAAADNEAHRAPDPRRDYASPEELRDDMNLTLDQRIELLAQWKNEVDGQLSAESEGMSASDPIQAEAEARLASEERCVSKALNDLQQGSDTVSH